MSVLKIRRFTAIGGSHNPGILLDPRGYELATIYMNTPSHCDGPAAVDMHTHINNNFAEICAIEGNNASDVQAVLNFLGGVAGSPHHNHPLIQPRQPDAKLKGVRADMEAAFGCIPHIAVMILEQATPEETEEIIQRMRTMCAAQKAEAEIIQGKIEELKKQHKAHMNQFNKWADLANTLQAVSRGEFAANIPF